MVDMVHGLTPNNFGLTMAGIKKICDKKHLLILVRKCYFFSLIIKFYFLL